MEAKGKRGLVVGANADPDQSPDSGQLRQLPDAGGVRTAVAISDRLPVRCSALWWWPLGPRGLCERPTRQPVRRMSHVTCRGDSRLSSLGVQGFRQRAVQFLVIPSRRAAGRWGGL